MLYCPDQAISRVGSWGTTSACVRACAWVCACRFNRVRETRDPGRDWQGPGWRLQGWLLPGMQRIGVTMSGRKLNLAPCFARGHGPGWGGYWVVGAGGPDKHFIEMHSGAERPAASPSLAEVRWGEEGAKGEIIFNWSTAEEGRI